MAVSQPTRAGPTEKASLETYIAKTKEGGKLSAIFRNHAYGDSVCIVCDAGKARESHVCAWTEALQ